MRAIEFVDAAENISISVTALNDIDAVLKTLFLVPRAELIMGDFGRS
jgi:hypothetical protein